MADPDLYSALIGGAPRQADQQAALAKALRDQQFLGSLGQASGDRVLAPLGASMVKGAQSGAQDIAAEREKQQQLDTQEHWRNIQEGHYNDQVAYQKAKDAADNANRLSVAGLLAGNRVDIQDMKDKTALAEKAAKDAKGLTIPKGTADNLMNLKDSVDGVADAASTYKPGFGGVGRNAENWIAANVSPLSTQNMKAAQNWWANYGRQFTLDEMHRLYGARLSPQEMATFEKFHINQNMDDDQIQQNLSQIHTFLDNKLGKHVDDLRAGGYNPGFLDQVRPQSSVANQPRPGDKYMQQPPNPAKAQMLQQTLSGGGGQMPQIPQTGSMLTGMPNGG
jgi:hypothetical protein